MAKKLQNIKAMQQLLAGTHSSQTRKSHGFNEKQKDEKRIVGDVWFEVDPKTGTRWRIEQHEGFRERKLANSVRDQIKAMLTVPDKCPCCGSKMKNVAESRLNMKMYFIHDKCFDCVVKEETMVRAQGKEAWEEYSRKRLRSNAEAWFSDADREVDILRESLKLQFVQNADGDLEEYDMDSFFEKFDSDYKALKEQILDIIG